jgi:predicted DNA-binding transcriptional regulator AlpA
MECRLKSWIETAMPSTLFEVDWGPAEKHVGDHQPTQQFPPHIAPAVVLSYAEAAKVASISKATLRRLIAAKRGPPVIELSARRRGIRTCDMLAWLESRAVRCKEGS